LGIVFTEPLQPVTADTGTLHSVSVQLIDTLYSLASEKTC